MLRTNIYLSEEQIAALDELAHAEGVSRAELVRKFLGRSVSRGGSALEEDLAAIEGSFGVLGRVSKAPKRGTDERSVYLARLRSEL